MEPNGLDPVSAAALVLRAIEDIDLSTDDDREELLAELFRVAWGRPGAQHQ